MVAIRVSTAKPSTARLLLFAQLLLAWGLLALLGATPGKADWRELYKQGVDKLEAKQWAAAESLLKSALDENSESRFNRLGRRYFPHYYYGVALAEQGKCQSALDSWKTSKAQGNVLKANNPSQANPKLHDMVCHVGGTSRAQNSTPKTTSAPKNGSKL